MLGDNPFVTPLARRFWEDKQRLVRAFIDQLAFELFAEGPSSAVAASIQSAASE